MNISEKAFQEQSLDGFSRLNKIQRELSEQFNMNPILTTRLSSEIISEIDNRKYEEIKANGGRRLNKIVSLCPILIFNKTLNSYDAYMV